MWKPEPPEAVAKTIQSYTRANVPSFFVYAKDKIEDAVEKPTNSTMCRISQSIPNSRVSYSKSIGKCDWRMMINQDADYSVNDNNPVIVSYNYWLRHQFGFVSDNDNVKDDDSYGILRIRENIIEESGKDLDYIVNSLAAYTYTVTKSSNKKMLWACFGDEIVNNLKINLYGKGKICPVCGRRFSNPTSNRAITCSDECSKELNRRNIYNKKYGF